MKVTTLAPVVATLCLAGGIEASPLKQKTFLKSMCSSNNSTSAPLTLLTGGYSADFSVLSFDPATNKLSNVTSTRTAGSGPSWASWDANGNIYVTNDSADENANGLSHFRWDQDRRQLSSIDAGKSGLAGTVYISRSRGKGSNCLYAAGYGAKAISSQVLQSQGGRFTSDTVARRSFQGSGPDKARQDQSRPHQVIDSPDGKYIYVPDLGADAVHVFSIDDAASCTLKQLPDVKTSSGDGPRHLTFYLDSKTNITYAYLVTELSGTVRSYKLDTPTGNLTLIERPLNTHYDSSLTSKRAASNDGVQPSEVMVSPDGKFVYVANRHLPHNGNERGDEDAIALFQRDATTGALKGPVASYHSGGRNPRHASMSRDKRGSYIAVANQAEDASPNVGSSVAVLKRNSTDGSLTTVVTWNNVTGAAFAGWWSNSSM